MVKLTKVTTSKKKTGLNKKEWVGVWDNKEGRALRAGDDSVVALPVEFTLLMGALANFTMAERLRVERH